MGTRQHWRVICFCKFLRLVPSVPSLSPGAVRRKAQSWRGVPVSPFVPIEMAQVFTGTVIVAIAPAQFGFRIHGLSVSHPPIRLLPLVCVRCRWCVDFRLVFLSAPNA